MRPEKVFKWRTHKAEICNEIRKTFGELKIVLKTKNDRWLLSDWISHHEKIVGLENLIIFDNESDDEEVKKIYEIYRDRISIFSFDGFHNNIHDNWSFPELYSALRASSNYYSLLDTDERLVYFNGEVFVKDRGIGVLLSNLSENTFIPATWLYNVRFSDDRFSCGTDRTQLLHGLAWGKPVISCHSEVKGVINHNCQIARNAGLAPTMFPGLYLLRLANLSPGQRIQSNVSKLVARGFIARTATIQEIIHLNTDGQSENIKLYVAEIKMLENLSEERISHLTPLQSGCLKIDRITGEVGYYSLVEKLNVLKFSHQFEQNWAEAYASSGV